SSFCLHHTTAVFCFFQREDGIRDATVTGVQTCALPIWALEIYRAKYGLLTADEIRSIRERHGLTQAEMARLVPSVVTRSLDGKQIGKRRVGKECRSGGWPER